MLKKKKKKNERMNEWIRLRLVQHDELNEPNRKTNKLDTPWTSGTLTYFIKVEWKFARNRTIETSFKEWGPILVQDVLATRVALFEFNWKIIKKERERMEIDIRTLSVFSNENEKKKMTNLANTSNSWINVFTTVDIFDSTLAKEKVDILANVKWSNKIWFYIFKWEQKKDGYKSIHYYAMNINKKENLLSSHLESYLMVLLKSCLFSPVFPLYRSVRKMTVSALLYSATDPL